MILDSIIIIIQNLKSLIFSNDEPPELLHYNCTNLSIITSNSLVIIQTLHSFELFIDIDDFDKNLMRPNGVINYSTLCIKYPLAFCAIKHKVV